MGDCYFPDVRIWGYADWRCASLRDLLFWEGFDLGCVHWGIIRLGYSPIERCGNSGLQILIAEYKL